MIRMITIVFALCLMFMLSACPASKAKPEAPIGAPILYEFRHDGNLEILESGKSKASFDIEIVISYMDRAQGLMFRETMEDNQGMLFIFEDSDYHSFWMKNTYLPLDMLFISEDLEVVDILKNAIPFSEEMLIPEHRARYVLEVKGGISDQMNIKIGDSIKWNVISE